MRIQFDQMPDHARIWVYQANRTLSGAELHHVESKVEDFLANWAAHGAELTTAYQVQYNRFLFIALDETTAPPTGCSIDASVRMLKDFESETGVDFLNRMNITFKEEGEVMDLSIPEFQQKLKSMDSPESLMVFNNLITKKADLDNWEVPVEKSWHKQWL